MRHKKKYTIMLPLTAAIAGLMAGLPAPPREFKNLRVLPKHIRSRNLSKIMIDDFEDGLGVSCNFCHAPKKDSTGLDYPRDAKPEKQIARRMIEMTININKRYFKIKHPAIGDSTMVVTCVTCHNGKPHPEDE